MSVALFFAAPLVETPPAAAPAVSSVKSMPALPVAAQDPSSLVSILSKVEVSPADLLSALSKVQGQSSLEGESQPLLKVFKEMLIYSSTLAYLSSIFLVPLRHHLCCGQLS